MLNLANRLVVLQPHGLIDLHEGGIVRRLSAVAAVVMTGLALVGCGGADATQGSDRVLAIGAIPDQDPQLLQRRYTALAGYMSETLDVTVRYVPVTDYTSSVTAYRRGDLDLAFFGGLTGVQAREQVPGSVPVAQRDIDAEFRSVFIAGTATGIKPFDKVSGLSTLAGQSFTFGSESSTSGRLMPQHFLTRAGVSLAEFAGEPGFSGAHDTTIALVEAGTYEVGVLSESVWKARLAAGEVDATKVREIFRTPEYHDYHWLARPDLNEEFGPGFTQRVTDALLSIDGSNQREAEILNLLNAGGFVKTRRENYDLIEQIARNVGLLR